MEPSGRFTAFASVIVFEILCLKMTAVFKLETQRCLSDIRYLLIYDFVKPILVFDMFKCTNRHTDKCSEKGDGGWRNRKK